MSHLLAASEIEIGFGLIVFIIWVLSAIFGGLKKAGHARRSTGEAPPPGGMMERVQQEIAEQLRRMNTPHTTMPMPPRQQPLSPPIARPHGKVSPLKTNPRYAQSSKAARQAKRKQPAHFDAPPFPDAEPVVRAASAPRPAPRAAPTTVNAQILSRWMKPATLRQQFILTEIFQPPLSMRDGPR